MNKGGSQKVGDLTVTMTHAIHSCGILDDGKILYGGEVSSYVLRLPDSRALSFAGDTNVFSDMHLIHRLYQPELAFLPIGEPDRLAFTQAKKRSGMSSSRALPSSSRAGRRDRRAGCRGWRYRE